MDPTDSSRAAANAADAIAHVKDGGTAYVSTATRTTIIDLKTLNRFERAGHTLLKDHSDGGITMLSGKSRVYLFPGQLRLI